VTAPGEFGVGDPVEILPPYQGDDIFIEMHHSSAKVAAIVDGEYMVTLGAVHPPDRQFGPFPRERLRPRLSKYQNRRS
jgi:hypothetical protein